LDDEPGKGRQRTINIIVGTLFWLIVGFVIWSFFD